MDSEESLQLPEKRLETLVRDLERDDQGALRSSVENLHPAEIAHLIESLPAPERERLWDFVPEDAAGEVIAHLGEVARVALVEELTPAEVISAAGSLESAELAEVIETLPEEISGAILESLESEDRERLEATLAFPEHSAGRLMSTDVVAVRADLGLDVVLRYLRLRRSIPTHTDGLMVIDREGRYLGKLPVSSLLTADPERTVQDIMEPGADRVPVSMDRSDVAALFERRDLVSVAVVDESDRLLGRITIDDVVDVIREQADEQILRMAGLSEEEDLFAPVLSSARRRALWLGINLATAFLASWVIGLFEATIDKVVALAVLMPIVASMGGIAGSQTLTLTIRGIALGQIGSANARWLTSKELAIGVINGLVWAAVVGSIAVLWFRDYRIGLIIAAAMVLNLLAAALAGIAVPLILRRLHIDPALSGSVVLTTVTDVVGFMSFLGLATVFLR